MNGTAYFTLSRGFWRARVWTGEESIHYSTLLESRGAAERWASEHGFRAVFVD